MNNFGDWLVEEIEKRDWSKSDLAKAAGISRGTLSNIISGTRGVGEKTLVAIANALDISPTTTFRKAGFLPEEKEISFDDWQHLLEKIPPEDREEILQILTLKVKRNRKAGLVTNLKTKKARK